jgi:hypothetical protein
MNYESIAIISSFFITLHELKITKYENTAIMEVYHKINK